MSTSTNSAPALRRPTLLRALAPSLGLAAAALAMAPPRAARAEAPSTTRPAPSAATVAGQTFEELARGALVVPPGDGATALAELLDPLVARCGAAAPPTGAAPHAPAPAPASPPHAAAPAKAPAAPAGAPSTTAPPATAGPDLATRQCEAIRGWHVERLHGQRFVVTGDESSLAAAPYDAAEKTLTLTVTGCISCRTPPLIEGQPRLVVTKRPTRFEDGVPTGIDVAYHDVPLADGAAARRFLQRTLPKLRVQYVVTRPQLAPDGKAILVQALAHRIYDRCSGALVASDPPSVARALAADATCPKEGPTEEEQQAAREYAALPESLTRGDIERAMAPVAEGVAECASTFELSGTAHVAMVIHPDAPPEMKLLPPFDTGEANLCLKAALRKAKFPRFKRGTVKVDYPFVLNKN